MKTKRKMAWLLIAAMTLNIVPTQVFGMVQVGLSNKRGEGIKQVIVSHRQDVILGDNNILPDVSVEWEPAPDNTQDDTDTGILNPNKTRPDGYRFELTDVINSSLPVMSEVVGDDSSTGTFQEKIQEAYDKSSDFQNGKLYKLRVIPYHEHLKKVNDETTVMVTHTPPDGTEQPVKYIITDFNTQLEDTDGKLEVSWEYIEGATYELLYSEGNITEKSEMFEENGITLKAGTTRKLLTNAEAQAYIKNGKVVYTISDAKAGQLYSACVVVKEIENSKVPVTVENIEINTDDPKIAQETTSVPLKVFNISKDKIRLEWTLGDWLIMGASLYTTTIYEKLEGNSEYKSIGVIDNKGVDPGYYNYREPSGIADYYVEFVAKQGDTIYTITTKEVRYVREELKQNPLQPQIPNPFSKSLSVDEIEIKDYLVKNDDIAKENNDLISHTFHAEPDENPSVQLVWGTQQDKEDATKVAYDLIYDLYVVEDKKQLESYDKLEPEEITILEGDKEQIIYKQDGTTAVGFKHSFSEYIDSQGNKKELIPNKTYYIQLIAKRSYGEDVYAYSEPAVVAITLDKDGDISTPAVISKPPLELVSTTNSTAKLKWLDTWHEIMPRFPQQYQGTEEEYFADTWNSRVYTGVTSEPYIRLMADESLDTELEEHILNTQNDVDSVIRIVGEEYFNNNYVQREVTLGSDVRYEVKPILYDDVLKELEGTITTPSMLKISKWIADNEDDTTEGWSEAVPTTSGDSFYYTVEGLKPNTRYLILIRAYRMARDGVTKLQQAFPSFVIGTTESDREEPEAIPKVPVLNKNGVTDSSVSVWWIYNSDFDYEIVYSRSDDPDKATTYEFSISDTEGDENYVVNGGKAEVTIPGLLPETTYNVWIRAKQKVGSEISSWSNPVTQTTKSIEEPDSPSGLGLAASQSIIDVGLDFEPRSSTYITVEWLKDVNDFEDSDAEGQKVYTYVVECADNPEFLDATSVTTSGGENTEGSYEILSKTMVRFTGLNANMPYYFRVKTIVTYTNGDKTIVKESEFCKRVKIKTGTSSDEYDGGDNKNVVTFDEPIKDTYKDNVWTKELQDVAKIVSDIQSNGGYYYEITMQYYKSKDADVRIIKMPKQILDTLINRSMAFRITTNIGQYEIPAKGLEVYSQQYSAGDTVQFEIAKQDSAQMASILRSYPETLVKAEKLAITFSGKNKRETVNKLDEYMNIKLKLDVVTSYQYNDYFTYTYNYAKGDWTKEASTVQTLTESYLTYRTPYTGCYALYQKQTGSTSNSTYLMTDIANNYNVIGLGTIYGANTNVRRDQFVTLMLGIAEGSSSIDLTTVPTSSMIAKAKTSGLYISSNTGEITKEQAIAGAVKLYELTHQRSVKPSSMTFSNVSSTYREAAAKAYAIGLVTTINNPTGKITYSELCDLIVQAISLG